MSRARSRCNAAFTVTRLLAVGIFALAWRKKQSSAFLVFEMTSGSEIIFASSRHTEPSLHAALSRVITACNGAPAAATSEPNPAEAAAPERSVADRLRDLASLRDEGLITDEEFAEKRQQLVDGL